MRQRSPVDHRVVEARVLPQRLQLGAEQQRPARRPVEERLLAEPVPREEERPLRPVPERDREHPVEALEGPGQTPGHDGGKDHLRVAARPKCASQALQLMAQRFEVVDLAVEREHVTPVGGRHRLVPERREIDDRQPAVPERDPRVRVDPVARVVGPAVRERVAHPRDQVPHVLGTEGALEVEKPRQAAHGFRFTRSRAAGRGLIVQPGRRRACANARTITASPFTRKTTR